MKIGITLGLQRERESMWINGIKLNAIFLQNALIKAGHDAILLDCFSQVKSNLKDGSLNDDMIVWDTKKFPIYKFDRKVNSCDVLILLGVAINADKIENFKASGNNKKVIKYACGNNYVIDMETMLFKNNDEIKSDPTWLKNQVDELWYVPQQGYHNHHYYAVTHGLPLEKVMPVPFIWDPMFIDEVDEFYGRNKNDLGEPEEGVNFVPVYQPGKPINEKRLCVFEPNLNVVKFSMIPTLIAEDYISNGNEPFYRLYVGSGDRLYKNKFWKAFVQRLDMVKTKKNKDDGSLLLVEHRYPIHFTLAKFADVVISHQWDNPLNYAYLDVMYLQYPLIHNADMIKDAGYYYPDFKIKEGSKQLKNVLELHDSNIDSYNEKNEKVLTRYTVYNEEMLNTYNKLLDNLIQGSNKHKLSLEYNWETNLYK